MRNRSFGLAISLICMIMLVAGCKGKDDKSTDASTLEAKKEEASETVPVITVEEPVKADSFNEEAETNQKEENTGDEDAVKLFAGTYYFSSGAGAWGTEVTIDETGKFSGNYSDSDMGDIGDDFPNGIRYYCEFEGEFSDFTKVDDYTYSAKLGSINHLTETGSEKIIDGVKYVYSEPYGLENGEDFEFYLPGKKVSELTEDFLSWTSLRYSSIYPSRLYSKSFYNIANTDGFECGDRENVTDKMPESMKVEPSEIAGQYEGDNGSVMCISIFSVIEDDASIGNITFLEDETSPYQPEASIGIGPNGFLASPQWETPYTLVVTDNASGSIELSAYDDYGFNLATFKMTEHYES